MSRSRDRSFCCGGGGLMLFYEPKEEQRMGVKRVQMAAEAGANVIVTACPFCMVNIEDAIKVAGLEGKMTAIDLTELVDQQIARESSCNREDQSQTETNSVVFSRGFQAPQITQACLRAAVSGSSRVYQRCTSR